MGDLWPEDYYMHLWSPPVPDKPPALPPLDWNPDHQRSPSSMWVEDRGKDLIWVLRVRDLGAIVMRATSDPETGRLSFEGLSEFSDTEIGWRQ